MFYSLKLALDEFLPEKKLQEVKAEQMEALKRLGHGELDLDEHERTVANEVIHPDDINVKFTDIGGLDAIVASWRESIIYPLGYPNIFSSRCSQMPPTFINIAASVLTNKWFGESNKLVAALFKLATSRKEDTAVHHLHRRDRLAEFMTQWDGLLSSTDRILVLGATNRPNDIDAAILRRMPKRYAVSLPNFEQRLNILNLILQETPLAPDFPMTTFHSLFTRASHRQAFVVLPMLCLEQHTHPPDDIDLLLLLEE
ncbi:P-loop containing nucleoside triphosphate hydrolase protein [Mycena amicta]|nr:P-loop containing nucleoside triphosphate hydrolase protein [Mycena amicta]